MFSNKINNIINNLINVTHQCSMTQRHAAAVLNKKSVTYGVNHERCRLKGRVCCAVHAEQDAINRFMGKNLKFYNGKWFCSKKIKSKKLSMFIIRVNSFGELIESAPCKTCIDLMKAINISKIYYSNSSGNITCSNINNLSSFISVGDAFLFCITNINYNSTFADAINFKKQFLLRKSS